MREEAEGSRDTIWICAWDKEKEGKKKKEK